MDRIRWDLNRLTYFFPGKAVAEIVSTKLIAFLEAGKGGMKTHNNRRGLLSTVFKYCFLRGWVAKNPIPKVPRFRIRRKRGLAQTLNLSEVKSLMEFAQTHKGGIWGPYFAFCLFAGIRPA